MIRDPHDGLPNGLGPFPNSDAPAALLTGFGESNYSSLPPTTLMTGNTTQAVLDAVDLPHGVRENLRAHVLDEL